VPIPILDGFGAVYGKMALDCNPDCQDPLLEFLKI
jgi:hypothetical protein